MRYVADVETSVQLHLCDERSEELCVNSTGLQLLRPCRGAFLIRDTNGNRRLLPAHRGSRDCTDETCRRRYRARVFALALNGIVEEASRGIAWAKLLTLTLPNPVVVPARWVTFGVWSRERVRKSDPRVEVDPDSPQAYRYMAERFNAFQTAARREWTYSYFRVVEHGSRKPYTDERGRARHATGRVHYHLLVMCKRVMSQERIVQLARDAGLGVIADIRAVRVATPSDGENAARALRRLRRTEKLAGYLAAYAAKDGGACVPYRMRFYVMSRGWAHEYQARYAADRRDRLATFRRDGGAIEYVRGDKIEELLATSKDIVDLRERGRYASARSAHGPQRPEMRPPASRRPRAPRGPADRAA